jgi:hypothetical protein
MRFTAALCLVLHVAVPFRANAFLVGGRGLKKKGAPSVGLTAKVPGSSFVPNLPIPEFSNPLKRLGRGGSPSGDVDDGAFDASPEGLVALAQRVLSSDLGLQDPSLLDDDRFQWIGPSVDKPLDKTDYLAAGRFFDLRSSFPDLNYRAHDFRVDENDPCTVRMTCRIVGTMRGELRLRDTVLAPTGNTMRCPPEAFSMTVDMETGNIVKLCTGFCLDRLVGNTEGTTGVVAAAITGGQPISDWEIYPPATVLKRFFGRPVQPLPEVTNFLAPFPETVMIQLAKGLALSNMASEDPSLLADDFTYCTPTDGPIRKNEFLEKYAAEEFKDVNPNFSNYRVDPYDPERVWVDLNPSGPGYQGCPQAMSFAFDQDGFCTRVTAGAVMDPTIGDGGGLGGPKGLRFARGGGTDILTTFPLPRALGRLKNYLLAPLFGSRSTQKVSPQAPPTPKTPVAPPPPPVRRLSIAKASVPEKKIEKPTSPLMELPFGTINLRQQKQVKSESAAPKGAQQGTTKKKSENLPSPLQKLASSLGSINLRQTKSEGEAEMERQLAAARKAGEVKARQDQQAAVDTRRAASEAQKTAQGKERQVAAEAQKTAQEKASAESKARREQQAAVDARRAAAEAQKAAQGKERQAAAEAQKAAQEKASKERQAAGAVKDRQAVAEAQKAAQEKDRQAAAEAQKAAQAKAQAAAEAQKAAQEKSKERQAATEAQKAAQEKALKERQAATDAQKAAQAKAQAAAEAQKAAQEKSKERQAATEAQKVAQAKALKERQATAEAQKAAQAKALKERQAAQEKTLKAAQEKTLKERQAAAEAQQAAQAKTLKERQSAAQKAAQEKAQKERQAAAGAGKAAQDKDLRDKLQATERKKRQEADSLDLKAFKEQKQNERSAIAALAKAASRATVALFGLGKPDDDDEFIEATPPSKRSTKKAPRGVPTISRWRKNFDGSISGRVSGSRDFDNGEKITTSPIPMRGSIASGEVVSTGSGSKYFLE